MSQSLIERIRNHARPLEPVPTDEVQTGTLRKPVRAVLFDVYGTLFISGSGDIGISRQAAQGEAFTAALRAVGAAPNVDGQAGVERMLAEIESRHQAARKEGVDYPEVDIADVWWRVVADLHQENQLGGEVQDEHTLAVEYEARTNPVWPMPAARDCLTELAATGLPLGIVSNAQFFTPLLFPALLEKSTTELGFHPDLEHYSYRYKRAKPGEFLYRQASAALEKLGIPPQETAYVGNDMLNDVWPADKVGFQTVLFAGDARSLRRRGDDPRVSDVVPTMVITNLAQLPDVLPGV